MKEIKITPPNGYEIDKDNSTFEKIVFKEIKKELPKRWEELGKIKGYYTTSGVNGGGQYTTDEINKNVFFSKEQAHASIALAQLSQLREVYRQGWKPDWGAHSRNYCINYANELYIWEKRAVKSFLSFQSKEVAEEFLNNFRDLIEQASPLLFD